MAADIFQGSRQIGRVSTSGEVYYNDRKIGWVNGNGDIYHDGIRVGWVTRAGTVIDSESNRVGRVDVGGAVYRGSVLVGRVDCTSNRYCVAGAALLLILSDCARQLPAEFAHAVVRSSADALP